MISSDKGTTLVSTLTSLVVYVPKVLIWISVPAAFLEDIRIFTLRLSL